MTPDELIEKLRTESDRAIVAETVLSGEPMAFSAAPALYGAMCEQLATILSIDPSGLRLVGSGKLGFSLHPEKFPRAYHEGSDLDVDVVSARLFDEVWFDLLNLSLTDAARLDSQVREWVAAHRERRIFFGRAEPHRLRGAVKLTRIWFSAFKSFGKIPEFSSFEVHGMLFRTWEHATLYHMYGLRQIRSRLRREGRL